MEKPSLLLVGNGNMGSSFIEQIRGLFRITIVSPNSKPSFPCTYFDSLSKVRSLHQVVIFAVKPYQIQQVIKLLHPSAYDSQTNVISLIAGVKTSFFRTNLQHPCQIFLCLGNLPVSSGNGILAVYGPHRLDYLERLGQVIYCRDEVEIDKYTSVVGSGSGFVFHLLSVYERAAQSLDLGENVDTSQLVLNLFEGTLKMAKDRMQKSESEYVFQGLI